MNMVFSPSLSAGIMMFFFLIGCLFVFVRQRKGRILYSIVLTIAVGFVARDFLTAYHLIHAQGGRLTAMLWIELASVGLGTVILGRVYCGWVCPFGSLMYLIYRISPFKRRVPLVAHRFFLMAKYLLLFCLFVFAGFRLRLLDFEPFDYLFQGTTASVFFVVSLLYVVASFVIPYFWCRYFCFLGALWGALSVYPVMKYRLVCRQAECGRCASLCPTQAITERGNIVQPECVRCNECQVCKNG